MNEPLISVIVPVYKVEHYLEKCVQSIRKQTMEQIEIILVDDGSPDRCGEMCESFSKQDSRIRVIHKENGGLSDARNCGISAANTDIVAFIDSDDYIDPDMMEMLYRNMEKEQADISVCGMYHHFSDLVYPTEDTIGYCAVENYEAVKLELTKVPVSAVNKLYKKSLFSDVHFPKGKLYEDAHTTIPLTLKANKVVYELVPKYHYIHREDSITTKPYRPQVKTLIEANKNNMILVQQKYPDLRKETEYRYYWSYFWVVESFMLRNCTLNKEAIQDKEEIYHFLKRHSFSILMNPYFKITRKIAALALFLNKKLYEKIAIKYMNRNYASPSAIQNQTNG